MLDSSLSRRCWSALSARAKFSNRLPGSLWACSTACRTMTRCFSAMARAASSRWARNVPPWSSMPGNDSGQRVDVDGLAVGQLVECASATGRGGGQRLPAPCRWRALPSPVPARRRACPGRAGWRLPCRWRRGSRRVRCARRRGFCSCSCSSSSVMCSMACWRWWSAFALTPTATAMSTSGAATVSAALPATATPAVAPAPPTAPAVAALPTGTNVAWRRCPSSP